MAQQLLAPHEEAPMATMALLRVAETAMKTKGDHSDDAVLYSERLHHALTDADDATAKTHAPAALLPLGILLMRPVAGRRREAAVEAAALAAETAARRCGGELCARVGPEVALRLLGAVGLRLNEPSTNREERPEALASLATTIFRCAELGENDKAWAGFWKRLDDPEAPDGRCLVAAVAKAAMTLAERRDGSRSTRRAALTLVRTSVAATPLKRRGGLWRCFLPGLFGPLYKIVSGPVAPRDGDRLKADALAAAVALITAACGGDERAAPKRVFDVSSARRQSQPARAAARRSGARRAARGGGDVRRRGRLADGLDLVGGHLARLDGEVLDARRRGAVDGFVAAFEVEDEASLQALDAPDGAPPGLRCHGDFAKRVAHAMACGARYHRVCYRWLRQTATRHAARRAVWLLCGSSRSALVLALERSLRGLADEAEPSRGGDFDARRRWLKRRLAHAAILAEAAEAASSGARADLLDPEQGFEDVTEESAALEAAPDLVVLAEVVADEVLGSAAWSLGKVALPTDAEEKPRPRLFLRSGAEPTTFGKDVAALLCRCLAAAAAIARSRGASPSALLPLLRRVLYPLLEKLASEAATSRQAALGALVSIAALARPDGDPQTALPRLLAANMDYVVEAACRKLRGARSPETAALSSSVVEALLRHSECSLATPLLRDVVRNALRDVDDHCLDGSKFAAEFLRLMRSMLVALPRIAPEPDRNPDVENTGYWKGDDPPEPTPEQAARVASMPAWLRGLARKYGDAEHRKAALAVDPEVVDPVVKMLLESKQQLRDDDPEDDVRVKAAKLGKAQGDPAAWMSNAEKLHRGSQEHTAKMRKDEPKDPTPEEQLVIDVCKRAKYFCAAGDLRSRALALDVVATAADRMRDSPEHVRPLVHDLWPAVAARLPRDRAGVARIYARGGPDAVAVGSALDVAAAFAAAVGDFLAFKFKDELWPRLKLLLDPPALEDGHAPRNRDRVVVAAMRCVRRFADREDCFDLARPGAARESDIPNVKGSDLGHVPLVSADFWTSDHLSERSRSVDVFSVTRARGTLALNHSFPAQRCDRVAGPGARRRRGDAELFFAERRGAVGGASELSFGEGQGRARAAARKAEAEAVKAKLATLGGVEGQVSTPGGVTAVETLTAADLNPIKMKREPDRRGEDAPEPGILADLPTIKFQMKRAPGNEDSDSPQVLKMKR
ncbi:hypothetical protein JL721_6182 [Aureococcus anophagefferens]|nr:hypothetical protein JL721_6182 [Aureococcus anophagefferens]